MELPKISHPILKIRIPSTKKDVSFRPFLVKEEKILLMAKQSDTPSDILHAIKQVVNNCALDEKFNPDLLTIFDLEYIFLKLRAASVDNIVEVSYRDYEDNKVYKFDVDLTKVEVVFPPKVENKISISKETGMIMKYPPATLYDDKSFLETDKDYIYELIIRCVDKVYDGETVFEAKDYNIKQIREFIESLDVKTFDKIRDFLMNLPKLEYVIKYKNMLGHDREVTLSSLNDFFTLR